MRLLPALLAFLLVASPASASTISSTRTTENDRAGTFAIVTYVVTGTAGDDVVTATRDPGGLTFRDVGGLTGAAEGCRREDAATLRCPAPQPFAAALEADLGAGDDRIEFGAFYAATVSGGGGDDRLTAHGSGTLRGGAGADVLAGGGDSDQSMDGGPGPDLLDPGIGRDYDRLNYAERTGGVRVNVGGDEDAGEAGERDVVKPGFEVVKTGAGPDTVFAAADGNLVVSGEGDDVLHGGPGFDRLETGGGADAAFGGGGYDELFGDGSSEEDDTDHLDGGTGGDYVYGSAGPDVVVGGPGRDELIGGPGADRIVADDGEIDTVFCEGRLDAAPRPTRDEARVDRADEASWCGSVIRTGPVAAELLFAGEPRAGRGRSGTAIALVSCRAPARRCLGTVTLRTQAGRVIARRRFIVPTGPRHTIRLPYVLRRGDPTAPGTELAVRLVATDAAGGRRITRLSFERKGAGR